MARLLGPDGGTRYAYLPSGAPAANANAVAYTDSAGTLLADIRTYDGSETPGAVILASQVTTDGNGQLQLFWFPDGLDKLWVRVGDGPLFPVDADNNRRLDALTAAVDGAGHNRSLRKWYGALAARHESIASVVVIGDSNSEGSGVTALRRRWQQVLQLELRARFQPSGVAGATTAYISASPRLSPLPGDYPRTVTAGVTTASYGLGIRAAAVITGESVTFTFTGTRARLFGTKGASVGKYSIKLNGGAETVVDGVNASVVSGQLIWDSGALTVGAHTVVVARAASTVTSPGPVYPEGLMTYNGDESSGVRVVDASRHGATLATFTGSTVWQTAFTAVEGKGLLIMPWGANDSTSGTSVAAFRTGVETLISAARTAGFAGSVLLVQMPKRGTADPQVWADYLAQIDAIAAADPDVATLNLRARMPDQGTSEATTLGLYADEVHYSDKGHGWIADQIATAILPR
ncbi:SGNH/GDSL hydrolase family protein [Micromonospora sp. NPDC053740]|uniref:SGNH/GDSL hydrolase family protein n=1 Tax=Micromonospora sp. NPDC053740 TaxID=3155173 RepID=UPI00343E0A56